MKISVSSYSFQQYIKEGKMTQLDTISYAHDMNFEAIEFIDIAGENQDEQLRNAQKYADEAAMYNMKINAYSIGARMYWDNPEGAKKEIERLKGQLKIAKELGAEIMRHDICYDLGKTGNSRSFGLMLPQIAENINIVCDYAKELGIKTCVENHGYIAQDSYRVEELFNTVNNDNFGLLVDIGNFLCADEYPVAAVSRVAPYAVHVHAKDMHYYPFGEDVPGSFETRGCNRLKGAITGHGDVPVKQCLAILKRAGYNGYVSIEFEGEEDCIHGIEQSYINLSKIIDELK